MTFDNTFWVGPAIEPDTYQLINTLGAGGEGQVWRAVVPLSSAGRRQVAIKIMTSRQGATDPDWTRFGHLLKSLSHPGLVRVPTSSPDPVCIGTDNHRRRTNSLRGDGFRRRSDADRMAGRAPRRDRHR